MDQTDIINQLGKTVARQSALETLMDVEAVLDNLNVYAYENWFNGEIVDGPVIEKYWVTVTVMYDYKSMPDPEGALRLTDNGCKVYFAKETHISAAKLVEPEDSEQADGMDGQRPGQPRAKRVEKPVWLVTLEIPRTYLNSMSADKIQIDDMSIDVDSVEDAYDEGLGDEDAIRS